MDTSIRAAAYHNPGRIWGPKYVHAPATCPEAGAQAASPALNTGTRRVECLVTAREISIHLANAPT